VFRSPGGDEVPAVTAEAMRELDRVAVEEVGLELLQMMENAGRHLAGVVRAYDGPVVVLAGDGGNGGGGLCAARHLANHGRDVTAVLDRDPGALTGAAATQRRILRATDATVTTGAAVDDAGVVVDALVGYGLSGALRGRAADLAEAADASSAPVVSLDVPSGVDATTGDAPGAAVTPSETLTLALPKTGLASATTGTLRLADIGIPPASLPAAGVDPWRFPDDADVVDLHVDRT
jgi:NAD(P)H-hydrate epimerase